MTMPLAALGRAQDGSVADDAKPRRRTFSAAYKLAILTEYETLTDAGAKGALLRREGLYSSHIVDWRRARDVGALEGLEPTLKPRRTPEQAEVERLRRRAERAEAELATHKLALEIQGKASELLGRLLAESSQETRQQP